MTQSTTWKRGDPPHGTRARYRLHLKNKQEDPPCAACKKAQADYTRQQRENSPEILRKHNYRTATHSRALLVLKSRHQEEFNLILKEIRNA